MLYEHSQKGLSLVGVLISTAILGFLVIVLARMHSNSMKVTKHAELRGELEVLRTNIRSSMSCPFTQGQCAAAGQYVNILRVDKSVAYATGNKQNGMRVGRWNFRARCVGLSRVVFERARIINGNFAKDPLNSSKIMSWQNLFATASGPCDTAPPPNSFCPQGEFVTTLNSDSAVLCEAPPVCPQGTYMLGVKLDGTANCRAFTTCPTGEYLVGYTGTGETICRALQPFISTLAACVEFSHSFGPCTCPNPMVLKNMDRLIDSMGVRYKCWCCSVKAAQQ